MTDLNLNIMEDNVTYTIRANRSARTITIRKYVDGKFFAKYRSFRLNDNDFDYYANIATQIDIAYFLKGSDYYVVI